MMSDFPGELRRIRTPVVYDAVERFGVRSRTKGYTNTGMKCMFPSLGAMVGYACTGKIVGELPKVEGERCTAWKEVWEYVGRSPKPSVMVVQDLDKPPGKGCAWGDVAASIFLGLGCVGAITNGSVRDIDEVEKLGFQLFAPSPGVGHGYIRFVDFETPVKVGGLVVYPGDLIHADKHGALVIPKEIPLDELVKFIPRFLESEASIICYTQSPEFSVAGLCERMDEHDKEMGGHFT